MAVLRDPHLERQPDRRLFSFAAFLRKSRVRTWLSAPGSGGVGSALTPATLTALLVESAVLPLLVVAALFGPPP